MVYASIQDGTRFIEKTLHIATHVGIANFSASSDALAGLRGGITSGESRSVDPKTVEDWKKY
jgi:hypothetical protein